MRMKTNCYSIDCTLRGAARRLARASWILAALTGWTASAATLHVRQDNPNPASPFDSWGNAATNIQDAVDAAQPGDLVLVTNGVYATGGRALVGTMTNRVVIDKAITVQSVNGPEVTVIKGEAATGGLHGNGDGAIRCVYLGMDAVLSGFTLTDGHTETDEYGGGARCVISAVLTNCVLIGNSADESGGGVTRGTLYNCTLTGNSAGYLGGGGIGNFYNCLLTDNSATEGGGAAYSTLNNCMLKSNRAYYGGGVLGSALRNCILTGNSADNGSGGASYDSTLYNWTLTENSAFVGGGAYGGELYNCIVYFNSSPHVANYYGDAYDPIELNYSCTTPTPTNGIGNITNAPIFIDMPAGDLHLRYGSPGIDAGTDLSDSITTDFDGDPRPLDGDGDSLAAFDMGAYEFNAYALINTNWLAGYGLDPFDPQVVWTNPDLDPFNTFEEWLADTDPTNALSFFHIENISKQSPAMISFQSSSNRTYTLWGTPQLAPADWTPVPGQQVIPGTGGTMTMGGSTNALQQFYRVEVNLP
jgi:hypothetical protein